MEQTFTRREWLDWLTRVRLLMIALILGVGVVWPQYIPSSGAPRFFLPIVILWITLGILHLILVRWMPAASWHGGCQVGCDVVTGLGAGLCHRPPGQLFHFALSAGDHRGQHSVFSQRSFLHIGVLFGLFSAAMTGLVYHGQNSPHLAWRPHH